MYRSPKREEMTILRRFFDKWGAFDFIRNRKLMIKEKRVESSYFVPTKKKTLFRKTINRNINEVYLLSDLAEKILLDRQPFLAGLMIGELNKKLFTPSLQGADIIARVSHHFPYVVVNLMAEKVVLYGKNILGQSIVDAAEKLKENELVILLNMNKEPIGIGRTKFNKKDLLRVGKDTVTTVADVGYYLRNESRVP
jgi:60S ribosome subunit biogenesis protein NIP7